MCHRKPVHGKTIRGQRLRSRNRREFLWNHDCSFRLNVGEKKRKEKREKEKKIKNEGIEISLQRFERFRIFGSISRSSKRGIEILLQRKCKVGIKKKAINRGLFKEKTYDYHSFYLLTRII